MSANNVILFYNSHSGAGTFAGHLDMVIEAFQKKGQHVLPYKVDWTAEPMIEYLNSLDRDSVAKIIMAGGDGTVDLCMNAVIKADYHVPVAIFPTGTANDTGAHLGIPSDIYGMLEIAVDDFTVPMDIGEINGQYFVNEASLGSIVEVSQKTDQKSKNSMGMLGYYLRGIEEIAKIKTFDVEYTVDGVTDKENIYLMFMMNGDRAGGFKKLAPRAKIDDGKMDVIMFRKCPPREFLNLLAAFFIRREHIKSPYVRYFQTDNIDINTDSKIAVDIDGDKGPEFPLSIRVLPQRINVCVPRAIR